MRALVLPLVLVLGCSSTPQAAAPCVPPAPAASSTAPAPPLASSATPEDAVVDVGDLRIAVHARPFANLAFQLDCLAGPPGPSCDVVHALWAPTWSSDDDAALAAWKTMRNKYGGSTEPGVAAPPSALPLPYSGIELDKRLTVASLLASTTDDYRDRLRVLLPPQDAQALVEAAEHFHPRFETWWRDKGAAIAVPFRDGTEALFRHGELGAILGRAARFYATALPRGTTIDFDLVVLPSVPKSTHAEQILSHGLIEVVPGERPEERMDVVCHELFHFFYATRTPEQQAALAARFDASPDTVAGVAWDLLDEVVATALGNGVVDHAINPPDYLKRSRKEMGFYMNHAIDATAKALLARTKEDPTQGAPLDADETVQTFLAATREALGADPRPIDYMHTYAAAADEGWLEKAAQHALEPANANSTYTFAPLDSGEAVSKLHDHAGLSTLLLVPRARLSTLAAYGDLIPGTVRAAVTREARSKGAFAYVWPRSKHAMLFLVVADDPASAAPVADALFASDKPVTGLFRLPRPQLGQTAVR